MPKHNKKITLSLVGLNGNAFSLMGDFQKQSRREGWTKEETDQVLNECIKGNNYDELVNTLLEHCTDPIKDDKQEIEDDDFEDYE